MINYNRKLMKEESLLLANSRGLQYADGLFETIIYDGQQLQKLNFHWERLSEGADVLQIKLDFDKDALVNMLVEILKKNELVNKYARLKLMVWRNEGGFYTPESSSSSFLLSAKAAKKKPVQFLRNVLISDTVRLQHSIISALKTLSSLPYVMAGLEKKNRGAEELLLLDGHGNLSEASAANLMFYDAEKQIFCTPPLSCGCINGVARRFFISELEKKGLKIYEQHVKLENLNELIECYTINVGGINQLLQIGNLSLSSEKNGLEIIKSLIE